MPEKNQKLIKMSLEGVRIELPSQKPIILLKEENGNRYLPIWIGAFEATAIALEISSIKTPRPMTHDLMMNILNKMESKVTKIEICDLKDNTFYALINMETKTYGNLKIDSRPSDAIALAVRSNCDIYAAENIIESAGLEIQTIEDEVAQFKDFLDHVTPDDFKQEE